MLDQEHSARALQGFLIWAHARGAARRPVPHRSSNKNQVPSPLRPAGLPRPPARAQLSGVSGSLSESLSLPLRGRPGAGGALVFGGFAFLPFSLGPPGDCPWRH